MCKINAFPVAVCCNQTTNLILPYTIKSVDRGAAWILAQKARGADNVLQLKAAKPNPEPSNVSVICSDGELYSFRVTYLEHPQLVNLKIEKEPVKTNIPSTGTMLNEKIFDSVARVLSLGKGFMNVHRRSQYLHLHLRGIYIKENALWVDTKLANESLIAFAPTYVRFFIRDKRRAKRTAVQEQEVFPAYRQMDSLFRGKKSSNMIFAFTPFTLLKSQRLMMLITDRNGTRQVGLHLKPHWLLKARAEY